MAPARPARKALTFYPPVHATIPRAKGPRRGPLPASLRPKPPSTPSERLQPEHSPLFEPAYESEPEMDAEIKSEHDSVDGITSYQTARLAPSEHDEMPVTNLTSPEPMTHQTQLTNPFHGRNSLDALSTLSQPDSSTYQASQFLTYEPPDPSTYQANNVTSSDTFRAITGFENITGRKRDLDLDGTIASQAGSLITSLHHNHMNNNTAPPSSPPAIRYTYRDIKGVLRDIWQPGDGDGLRDGEFPGAASYKERFRFLQHDFGPIIRNRNDAPKYVILDDLACYQILNSTAYTAKERAKFWFHDFSSQGTIKYGRANRGRAVLLSIEDGGEEIDRNDACGVREVGWGFVGDVKKKQRKYHFTGERNGYQEIQFEKPIIPQTPSPGPRPAPDVEKGGKSKENGHEEEELGNHTAERVDDQRAAEPIEKGKEKGNGNGKEQGRRTYHVLGDEPAPLKRKRPRLNTHLRDTLSPPQPARERRERGFNNTAPYGGPFHSQATRTSRESASVPVPTGSKSAHASLAASINDGRDSTSNYAGFIEANYSSPRHSPSPPHAFNHGARTVYGGMSYDYQDDSNFPAKLDMGVSVPTNLGGGHSLQSQGSEYDGDGGTGVSEHDSHFQSSLWQGVRDVELQLVHTKKKLSSRDEEIKGLRREIDRLRDMCVDRLRGRDEPELIDLVGDDNNHGQIEERSGNGDEMGVVEQDQEDEVALAANSQLHSEGDIGVPSGRLSKVFRMFSG